MDIHTVTANGIRMKLLTRTISVVMENGGTMMPDREKVIIGLKEVWDLLTEEEYCLYADYVFDALEVLMEKPVEPVPEHPVVINTLACGVCHAQVARWDTVRGKRVYLFRAKYCPECGRKVKWSDEDRPD